jgi:peptide/nickel transport system substrate-binding protein
VDELFEMGRKELDFDKRAKIYQEIHKLIYEDQPYTWMVNRPLLAAFNRRIRGVQFSPRGILLFTPSLDAWWVAAGESRHAAMVP